MFGKGGLIPLWWPPVTTNTKTASLGTVAAAAGPIVSVAAALSTDRQLLLQKAQFLGAGPDRTLELVLQLSRNVPHLRIRVTLLGAKDAVPFERYDEDLTGTAGGQKATSKTIRVPLENAPSGTYRIEVQPCDGKKPSTDPKKPVCETEEAPLSFDRSL